MVIAWKSRSLLNVLASASDYSTFGLRQLGFCAGTVNIDKKTLESVDTCKQRSAYVFGRFRQEKSSPSPIFYLRDLGEAEAEREGAFRSPGCSHPRLTELPPQRCELSKSRRGRPFSSSRYAWCTRP